MLLTAERAQPASSACSHDCNAWLSSSYFTRDRRVFINTYSTLPLIAETRALYHQRRTRTRRSCEAASTTTIRIRINIKYRTVRSAVPTERPPRLLLASRVPAARTRAAGIHLVPYLVPSQPSRISSKGRGRRVSCHLQYSLAAAPESVPCSGRASKCLVEVE